MVSYLCLSRVVHIIVRRTPMMLHVEGSIDVKCSRSTQNELEAGLGANVLFYSSTVHNVCCTDSSLYREMKQKGRWVRLKNCVGPPGCMHLQGSHVYACIY